MKTLRDKKGFTLVEIMVAMLIAAILIAAIYEVFLSDYKAFVSHNLILDTHQEEKMALEFMTREIQLIGYDAETSPVTADIITAKEDKIQFEEYNSLNSTRAKILYEYKPADDKVIRRMNLYDASSSSWIPGTDETIIDNVSTFKITYYSGDNVKISFDPSSGEITAADLPNVRRMDVNLKVKTAKKDPIRRKYLTRDLSTSIYVRNLGIDVNLLDTNAPDPPTNVKATDPHNCGELSVTWDKNEEGDLAGYIIYFHVESRTVSPYTSKVIINSPDEVSYTLTGLDIAPSNDPDSIKYYIAISAFDRSMNISEYSAEVSGDGTLGDNDTIPNPDKPTPPENFIGEDSGEGAVKLTWSPSTDGDIVGYRIYRSSSPITSFPVSASYNPEDLVGLVLVADEGSTPTVLDSATSEFTDTGLVGCRMYYYVIAAVNCDLTLISDDAGDDDTNRYTASDYRLTSGDGLSGPETDTPTGSDTTPGDTTPIDHDPYKVPELTSKAGWKRVFLSLTNPNRSDDPDFKETKVYFSTSGYPIIDGEGNVSGGTLIPDSGGVFTGEGSIPPIIFDSEVDESPMIPELEVDGTYYFLAVSFDLCGNPSDSTDVAITLSELCGDDPDYAGAPPVPSGLTSEGCYSYTRLTWNHQGITIVDLAGYHVYRSEGETFNLSSSTELTGGAPQWFSYYMDASVAEGGTYSYGIRATDCYYENISPSNPDYATAKANNISAPAILEGIKPGRVRTDEEVTYSLTGDIEITTPTFYHNSVTYYIENTSAGPIELTDLEIEWVNDYAYLSEVYIGSDDAASNTTLELVWSGRKTSTASLNFNKTLYDYGSPASGSIAIPVVLVFTDANGDVDKTINMREDSLVFSFNYINKSMPTVKSCIYEGFKNITLGPTIENITQNKPGVATPAWAVPGDEGLNPSGELVEPGGVSLSISANVYDNSLAGIKSVDLYYFVDSLNMYDETTGPPPFVFGDATYTKVEMENIAGSLYRTSTNIPNNDDSTVWFFILAVDNEGNFDRGPEIGSGFFNYYQQEGDVCNNTPNPPTNLVGTISAGLDSIDLSWDAPTENTDGSAIGVDLKGYNVFRSISGGEWEKINSDVVVDLYYTDSDIVDLATEDYSYYVTAVDFCEPTPNSSEPSSIYSECEGATVCSIYVNVTEVHAGDILRPNVKVCERALGGINDMGAGEIVYIQVCSEAGDADPIKMKEEGNTGVFYIDESFYGRDYIKIYKISDYPSSPSKLDLYVNNSDTITVGGVSDISYSSSSCDDALFDCSVTITVVPDPCDDVPNEPTGLSMTNHGQTGVTLTWTAPTTNTDGSTITDLVGYRIYRDYDSHGFVLHAIVGNVTTWHEEVSGKLKDHTYEYYIKAIDSCDPANESAESNHVSN